MCGGHNPLTGAVATHTTACAYGHATHVQIGERIDDRSMLRNSNDASDALFEAPIYLRSKVNLGA